MQIKNQRTISMKYVVEVTQNSDWDVLLDSEWDNC